MDYHPFFVFLLHLLFFFIGLGFFDACLVVGSDVNKHRTHLPPWEAWDHQTVLTMSQD